VEQRATPTGSAQFHLLASLFSAEVRSPAECPKVTPVGEIRQLRAAGRSVGEIARRTGATLAEVRRIVGKLDPGEKARRRAEQEAAAGRIDARPGPWREKVRRWAAETGQSGATLFRVIKRIKGRRPHGRPGA
jgi:hypothetical protein